MHTMQLLQMNGTTVKLFRHLKVVPVHRCQVTLLPMCYDSQRDTDTTRDDPANDTDDRFDVTDLTGDEDNLVQLIEKGGLIMVTRKREDRGRRRRTTS